MEDREKLPVLIHHWIEHNASHKEEFDKWAQRAADMDLGEVANAIQASADDLEKASANLNQALEALKSENA